ncbi:type II secretion system F family protein [Spirillospora sp. NPDC052242]
MTAALAALCVSAVVWTLAAPPRASGRVRNVLDPREPRPALTAHLRTLRERRTRTRRWRTSVIELCDGMAAELAAGRAPEDAFASSAAVLDPPIAKELLECRDLANLADTPGAEGLRLLDACWRVGAERGGTLATVLDGLAAALRDEEAQRQDVSVQLAGPRATARLLAVLPLLGIAMAAALGARPLSFLCGSLPGLACLIAGVALNVTGLYWTARLARNAESPRPPGR